MSTLDKRVRMKGDCTMRVNKYLYGWKFYCHYGQGWEYETFEETYSGMKENRKAYRENSPYPLKITRGRELNPAWEAMHSQTQVPA